MTTTLKTFTCLKLRCKGVSYGFCIKRQDAKSKAWSSKVEGKKSCAKHAECQDCDQGKRIRAAHERSES